MAKLALRAVVCAFALPVAAMILGAFLKPEVAVSLQGTRPRWDILPSLGQFRAAVGDPVLWERLKNSATLAAGSLALFLPISIASGVMMSCAGRRVRKGLTALYVLSLLMPFQVIMLPVFKLSIIAGVYNSHAPVMLLAGTMPMGALVIAALVSRIGKEQWQAASLETSSPAKTLNKVILPQIAGGILLMLLMGFAEVWNMVEQPLILIEDRSLQPLSLSLNDIVMGSDGYPFAGAVIYALPVLALFFLAAIAMRAKAKKP